QQFDESLDVVRNKPALLVGIAFNRTVILFQATFCRPWRPRAVDGLRAEPADAGIEEVAVTLSPPVVPGRIVMTPQGFRQPRDAPFGVGVLESAGNVARMPPLAVAEFLDGVFCQFVRPLDV